jgi:hypothetical protein
VFIPCEVLRIANLGVINETLAPWLTAGLTTDNRSSHACYGGRLVLLAMGLKGAAPAAGRTGEFMT